MKRMTNRPLTFLFTIFLLLISNGILNSQIQVERSKEKVIISGVTYYIHLVKKGETAYSVAKAYGITVEELTKENPPAIYGIKEGQSLRIPVKSSLETVPQNNISVTKKEHDDARYLYHNLNQGETVYSLSKAFGVSENDIIQSNPGMDITKLSVGTEIAIPRKEFTTSRQKFDTQDNGYTYHKVASGETMTSIAKQYGITVRQLRKENHDIEFPQVGESLKIPASGKTDLKETKPLRVDSVKVGNIEPTVKIEPPSGYTEVKDLKGTLNVAVLLPFYLSENSVRAEVDSSDAVKGQKTYMTNEVTDEWIYPGSIDFLEMYEGILLAADTLSSMGLNINLHTYDIKSDTVEITRLIKSGKLAHMDLILGPVYSNNLSIVAEYAKNLGIPVVSPVPLMNNSVLAKHPTLFLASSTLEIAQKAIAKDMGRYYYNNIVFVDADTDNIDIDVKHFKNLIFSELKTKTSFEDIKFKEFKFYGRAMFNNDTVGRITDALSEKSKNIVLIASEEPSVISEVIDNISSAAKRMDVKVFAYPVIRELDMIDIKELFDLDMLVYSPYWIDYSRPDVRLFNYKFQQKFNTEPLEKSYAWQGYDIAYYFISGLAVHGKKFIEYPQIHNPELIQTGYDFKRKGSGDGFENQKLFLVRYTKDYQVIREDDNKPEK